MVRMPGTGKGAGSGAKLRRNGNPNWFKGMPTANPRGNPDIARDVKRRKVASDWLVSFYHTHPKRLQKLMMRLVNEAEDGKNIRFLEICINLLEGPAKESGDTTNYNFTFLTDAQREQAQNSVKRIKAMVKSITVLPETTDAERSTDQTDEPAGGSGEGDAGSAPDDGAELTPDD